MYETNRVPDMSDSSPETYGRNMGSDALGKKIFESEIGTESDVRVVKYEAVDTTFFDPSKSHNGFERRRVHF